MTRIHEARDDACRLHHLQSGRVHAHEHRAARRAAGGEDAVHRVHLTTCTRAKPSGITPISRTSPSARSPGFGATATSSRCAPPRITSRPPQVRKEQEESSWIFAKSKNSSSCSRNPASPRSRSAKARSRCASAATRAGGGHAAPIVHYAPAPMAPVAAAPSPRRPPSRLRQRRAAAAQGAITRSRRRWSARSTAAARPAPRRSSTSAAKSSVGDTLCIIEAMKMMNQIESDKAGTRRQRSWSKNGDPVEFGQPLSSSNNKRNSDARQSRHRQPRRDRASHPARVPRARHQDRRRALDGRLQPEARAARRRVRLHRPAAARSDSYLNMPAIISAAEVTDSVAIHPGYGFLSENADFAERVEKSGFIFIGPKPETIRLMGDKVSAIKVMKAAGVPCVPGSDGPLRRRCPRRTSASRARSATR